MRRIVLLSLLVPTLLSGQGLGQSAVREATVRTTDSAHLIGEGIVLTYGLVGYKSLLLSPAAAAVRIGGATTYTGALDIVYTPGAFLTMPLTPYTGAEWNLTALPGTTVPGYVVFAGVTFNQLSKLRKTRSIFGQHSEVVPAFFLEGRVGQLRGNGRYHELDFGFAW